MVKDTDEYIRRVLRKIERTPEWKLREIMEDKYIDTPGNYHAERRDYNNDIVLYMQQNMGSGNFKSLLNWIHNYPRKVAIILK